MGRSGMDSETVESFFSFTYAGGIALTLRWLEAGCPTPPERQVELVKTLALHGAYGLFESGAGGVDG